MTKRVLPFVLAATSFLAAGSALGQTANQCQAGVSVIHVNGVLTDGAGAAINSGALERAMNLSTTSDGKPVRYYSVNVTNDGLGDLAEVVDEWFDERPVRRVFRALSMQVLAAFGRGTLHVVGRALFIPDAILDEVQEFLAAQIRASLNSVNARDAVAEASVKQAIETAIQQGDKVVLVPHSQGNFVMNDALTGVSSSLIGFTGIVGVAVPADHIGVTGQSFRTHVTRGPPPSLLTALEGDLVINPILTSLRGNTVGPVCFASAGHSFTGCYLKSGTESRTLITTAVRNAINSMSFPTGIIGRGIITATLTWGSQPDVDLHVFEPDGTHVFYSNLSGNFGTLDRDDTTSFGPENYVVCNATSLQPGQVFRIGVNYYNGSAPETASVRITAGTVSPGPFTRVLPTALGNAGNSNPVGIATITVTQENGRLKFDVR